MKIPEHEAESREPISRRLLLTGAIVWVSAIVAAPLLDLGVVYAFFARICHQLPDRSWFLAGAPLPVCIRCASIYTGFGLGLMTRRPASPRLLRVALAATFLEFALARLVVDVELARAVTGALLGMAVAGFAEAGVGELLSRQRLRFRTRPTT